MTTLPIDHAIHRITLAAADPEQRLAAALCLHAVRGAALGDDDDARWLRGVDHWIALIVPPGSTLDDVRELLLAHVEHLRLEAPCGRLDDSGDAVRAAVA